MLMKQFGRCHLHSARGHSGSAALSSESDPSSSPASSFLLVAFFHNVRTRRLKSEWMASVRGERSRRARRGRASSLPSFLPPSISNRENERLLKSSISHRSGDRIVRGWAPSFENWAMSICVGWVASPDGREIGAAAAAIPFATVIIIIDIGYSAVARSCARARPNIQATPSATHTPSPRRTATARRDSFLIELHCGMSTFRVGRRRRAAAAAAVLDIMDGQNQKYINCLDGLHVITAEQRPRRGKRISEPTEETIEETKEAIYKQQSERGILIDFFSRSRSSGPAIRSGMENRPNFTSLLLPR